MTLVVDASVALKWYLIEDGAGAARQILADGGGVCLSKAAWSGYSS